MAVAIIAILNLILAAMLNSPVGFQQTADLQADLPVDSSGSRLQ
jgi:hypothetical protein